MLQPLLARRVVAAAKRFQDWEPWREFNDQYLFAFEVPGEPHPVFGIVLGAAGQEFGLSLYRGERAVEQVHYVTTDPRPPMVAPMLLLSFDPIGAVSDEFLSLVKAAGVTERVIPTVVDIRPGGRGHPPTNQHLRLLAQILEAMLRAADAELLRPRKFDATVGGKVLTLVVDAENGKVRDVTARFTDLAPLPLAAATTHSLPWPLPELDPIDAHRLVGFAPAPFGIAGAAQPPWVLCVLDPERDRIAGLEVVVPDAPDDLDQAMQALASILAEPKDGPAGLPRRLTFVHRRLGEAMAEPLRERGVIVDILDEHPAATQFFARLRDMPAPDAPEPDRVPAAAAADRWLEHHRSLMARIDAKLTVQSLHARKPLTAFFGDPDVLDDLDEVLEELGIDAAPHRLAYRDWFVVAWRSKAKGSTRAEQLLAAPMPEAERRLLAARVAARTGLYRVVSRRASLVLLSDVYSDFEIEVDDGALAAATSEGQALPARIGNADGYHFVVLLGPLLSPWQINAATAYLASSFGSFTSADLQRRPELLAALWQWWMDAAMHANTPQLTNTDGDRLDFRIGTFAVDDWPRLLAAFARRTDLRTDDDGEVATPEHWTWIRADATGNTILAELQRVGDELLVETNSEPRLESARRWLEAMPGVRFVQQRQQQPDRAPRPRRPADAAALPAAALAQLQAQIDAMTLRWLDERVPALGNRTPRQAVQTAEGREIVLRLIRTWPDPGGMPGLRTPRERLRRELGLDGEGTAGG
jgi:Protein of unknown function (DUF2384)